MLKIIRRVLRLSGDLSKRIWASFVCGFLESMFGLLPICAVFFVLSQLQSGLGITGQTWGIVLGLIIGGLALRSIFKYLVYRLQSTAGFEFVARERITLGDRLRNVPMGFFHDHSMGELTATMTTDLNYLENYSMHILDKVTSGVLSMVVMAICVLVFDWRIGLVFLAGILLSFPVYNYMQKRGKELSEKRQAIQSGAIAATLEYVQGISVVKSFNMCEKNISEIEAAYEKNAGSAYEVERVFTPLNAGYSMVFRICACVMMFCAGLLATGGELIPVEDPFYLEWSEATMLFSESFQKLEKINPAATAMLVFPAVYEHLYLAYRTDEEFLPQFQENLKKTKEFFQSLLNALGE